MRFWHTLRGIILRLIWKERNDKVWEGIETSAKSIIAKSWYKLKIYMVIAWMEERKRVYEGRISLQQAKEHF